MEIHDDFVEVDDDYVNVIMDVIDLGDACDKKMILLDGNMV